MSNNCNCNNKNNNYNNQYDDYYNAPKKIGSSRYEQPKKHRDEDKIMVKNACGSLIPSPITLAPNTPLEIAAINLELDEFKKPSVLLEVSGVLTNTGTAAGTVSFRLTRTCNGIRSVISQNSSIDLGLGFTSFDFKFCDCSPCCDCAGYAIEFITSSAVPGTTTPPITLSIQNPCILAIVTESAPCLCNCCCQGK